MQWSDPGEIAGARRVFSENNDARPPGAKVDLAIIHCISLPPGSFGGPCVEQLFTNSLDLSSHPYFSNLKGLKVSAHFLIRRDGELVQFVSCERRAWHAGVSHWGGRDRCNDRSIGIEVEGTEDSCFANEQYFTLAGLLQALLSRYPITDIVAHGDVAPGRKTDPGPGFAWAMLRAGLIAAT